MVFPFEIRKFVYYMTTGHPLVGMKKSYKNHRFYGILNLKKNPYLSDFTVKNGDELC